MTIKNSTNQCQNSQDNSKNLFKHYPYAKKECMRYAIWNNKGGVGKTFLSFMLSSEYALSHPDKKVIVVDMCPQANLSEILLGGNSNGAKILEDLIKKEKTIGGYISSRIKSPHEKTGNETSFGVAVHEYNKYIPANLILVAGDPKLEIQAQVMNQISSQTLPPETWKNVHSWLLDLIIPIGNKIGSESTTTFIDCNPSFSAYTEIALLAANQVIIPCSSDGSSARAIDNITSLVYGQNLPDSLKPASFYNKVKEFGMSVPVIHSVLLNRSTQYYKKPSKAFRAMFDEIKERIEKFQRIKSNHFYSQFIASDIPDAHSAAIVCSHKGWPISALKAGPHEVHDITTQVNPTSLNNYRKKIKEFITSLV